MGAGLGFIQHGEFIARAATLLFLTANRPETQAQVHRVSGAIHKSYRSYEDAVASFYDTYLDNGLHAVDHQTGMTRVVQASSHVSLETLGIDPLDYERYTSQVPLSSRDTKAIVIFVGATPGVYNDW